MVKRISKKICAFALSIVCVSGLVCLPACENAKTIEDYPVPVIEVVDENGENGEETGEVKDTKDSNDADSTDEASLPEYDSLKEEGKYKFNPCALNTFLKQQVSGNPKVIKIARKIMQEVYDTSEKFELDGELECSDAEFELAYKLAMYSNPMMEVALIEKEEGSDTTYTVKYFPMGTVDEFNDIVYGEGIDPEEAKAIFDDYEKFLTDLINNYITSENTYMERAELAYKAIIENVNCEYDDGEDAESEEQEFSEDGDLVREMEPGNSYIERVTSGTLHPGDFQDFYWVVLNQLNVDCLLIGCYGQYHNQNVELLDKEMKGRDASWFWPVVVVDDKAYHCDIFFDKALLDTQRLSFEGYETDMLYFGMSDETRKNSMEIYFSTSLGTVNPVKHTDIPACPEDYKKN